MSWIVKAFCCWKTSLRFQNTSVSSMEFDVESRFQGQLAHFIFREKNRKLSGTLFAVNPVRVANHTDFAATVK